MKAILFSMSRKEMKAIMEKYCKKTPKPLNSQFPEKLPKPNAVKKFQLAQTRNTSLFPPGAVPMKYINQFDLENDTLYCTKQPCKIMGVYAHIIAMYFCLF